MTTQVPKELEEQALIDGASRWRAMSRVILPLVAGLTAGAVKG